MQMKDNYFQTLHRDTENRFWTNNPSSKEIELAIAHSAVACTTNPAYCSRLIEAEPDYINVIIDGTIRQESDCDKAALLVYQRASQRVMNAFLPIYSRSDGQEGFVTMQSDPRSDEQIDSIISSVETNRRLGPNYMAKIPVIDGAIEAIDYCVERKHTGLCHRGLRRVSGAGAV